MHVLNCVLFKITNSLADPIFKQDQNSTYRVTEAVLRRIIQLNLTLIKALIYFLAFLTFNFLTVIRKEFFKPQSYETFGRSLNSHSYGLQCLLTNIFAPSLVPVLDVWLHDRLWLFLLCYTEIKGSDIFVPELLRSNSVLHHFDEKKLKYQE